MDYKKSNAPTNTITRDMQDFTFNVIRRFHIGNVESEGEGEHFERRADGVHVLGTREAHVISDGKSLVSGELHISRGYVYRFFAVTVGKSVVDGVVGDGLPDPVFLHVSGAFNVEIHLAKVVEKGGDGDAFGRILKAVNILDALS